MATSTFDSEIISPFLDMKNVFYSSNPFDNSENAFKNQFVNILLDSKDTNSNNKAIGELSVTPEISLGATNNTSIEKQPETKQQDDGGNKGVRVTNWDEALKTHLLLGPWDRRLFWLDSFLVTQAADLTDARRVPLSTREAVSIVGDMVDYDYQKLGESLDNSHHYLNDENQKILDEYLNSDNYTVAQKNSKIEQYASQAAEQLAGEGWNNLSTSNKQALIRQVKYNLSKGNEKSQIKATDASTGAEISDSSYAKSNAVLISDFAKPMDEIPYKILSSDRNIHGMLSLINPYSVTRLYNGLKGIKATNTGTETPAGFVSFKENRMLDIRDQKRFYDVYINNNGNGDIDVLSISNPTTTNIIQIMNTDRWGRTPYLYQDFVFCKYFNRIPNNRLITLRKYAAPTIDNLSWDYMGRDKGKLSTSYTPVATALTYFGGDSGNSLKDIFKIESGLEWEELKADIWDVTGDTGEPEDAVADRMIDSMGYGNMFGLGTVAKRAASLVKFTGMMKNPNGFNAGAANTEKNWANLSDPNNGGPYANRIKGPLNRIDKVMKRKEGIKFSNDISLKFSYKARPIGGVNTKAVMLEILSNMLLMCSATAVFWGGGHKYVVQPHAYPWRQAGSTSGFMKAMYNGDIFGQNGAISNALKGIMGVFGPLDVPDVGNGTFSMDSMFHFLGQMGAGIAGIFGSALNSLAGLMNGIGFDSVASFLKLGEEAMSKFYGGTTFAPNYNSTRKSVSNVFHNVQSAWKANSVKQTTLPHIEGVRQILLGLPVGNWHLTIGNPLNPIAVIGNLICEGVTFEFGEELGPDDFPDELTCTVQLKHGMARDLAGIESMFNRGAGRIYQAPDYIKFWGHIPSSEEETKVDSVTGGATTRNPAAFMAVQGNAPTLKGYSLSSGVAPSNVGSDNTTSIEASYSNAAIITDFNRGSDSSYGFGKFVVKDDIGYIRGTIGGNMHTRHYTDS